MTLLTLISYIGVVAVLMTLISGLVLKINKSWPVSFLQNFCGALFIFSGWVKAVDPLGTAFKMEDYFAEFYSTFSGTALNFISPVFPFLSGYSTAFAVFMIIFEIILGIMLIIGIRPKLTAWAFLILVLFFTVLTGFTFMTGYVPQGVNFFEFSKWTAYKTTNMRVTDCGCFGDFIKLEPRISFYKDLVLLVPSVIFVLYYKYMHSVLKDRTHGAILGISTFLLLFYCAYNFFWDEPHMDFRPFKIGTDVAAVQKAERDAMAAVQVTAYRLTNIKTGEVKEIPFAEYLKVYESFPKSEWESEQIKTEPSIVPTKISDFNITDFDDNDVTSTYLNNDQLNIMLFSGKPYYALLKKEVELIDSVYTIDSVFIAGSKDSFEIVKNLVRTEMRKEVKDVVQWDESFVKIIKEKIRPFTDKAEQSGVKTTMVISGVDRPKIDALAEATGLDIDFYKADDKLIKTIGRSNPGIVLWQNGKILEKWHYKKLPDFDKVKAKYVR